LEQSDRFKTRDLKTQKILDSIIKQQDVFAGADDTQLALRIVLHRHEQTMTVAEQERHLAKLPNASQAAFNCYEQQHISLCLPDTRVEVLEEIMAWADGHDKRCIFWLNGLAGTGKSTIARTIARKYYEQGRLGASFLFSRGGGDASHAGEFFTSIALQLANQSPSLKHYISEAIAEHGNIAGQSLQDQWNQLVLRPLSKLDGNSFQSSYILIVDALDECDSENDIRIIVQLLAEARSLRTVQLRIFMTSRPEIPIRHGFLQIPEAEHQAFILHNISPAIIDHDISIFLEYNLRIIGQERALAANWPGEQAIKLLVNNASGLFIWAATACRFIREGRRFAVKRLDIILGGDTSTTVPEKHLNEIYITVLKNSISNDYDEQEKGELCEMLRNILGKIVVLFSPLSIYSLAKLLNISTGDIDQNARGSTRHLGYLQAAKSPDTSASPFISRLPSQQRELRRSTLLGRREARTWSFSG
jgi:hypothetical protein